MTDPLSGTWHEGVPLGTGIPATRIPLWQRRLLADIQNGAAAHTDMADEGPDRWGHTAIWESNLQVLDRKVSDHIERARTLEVPAVWIDFALGRGADGNEWTDDTWLPDADQGRDQQLGGLHEQLVVLEDMAVIDAERRYRHAHNPATAADPYPSDPDSYLDRMFRRNIGLRWMLATLYADAITATDGERDRLWAEVTAARPRRAEAIHARSERVLEKRWQAYASPQFAEVTAQLYDALEPDPVNRPSETRSRGFPTPHTLVALATEHIHARAAAVGSARPTTSPEAALPADIDHNRTWRGTNELTTIAHVIDRYRRLNSVSEAMDMTAMDPSDERDQARHIYMREVRHLLADMVRHVPAADGNRRQALANLLDEPDSSFWYGRSMDTLSRYWNTIRQDLDHDLANVAGVPLLLGMVRARDDIIADLTDQVADLREENSDRIADINEHLRRVAQADEDSHRLIAGAGLDRSPRADPEPTGRTPADIVDVALPAMEHNRIQLRPLDSGVPDREVFIGWDPGLGTYFAQVIDGLDHEGEDIIRVHLGGEPDEITAPAEAIDAIRPYAHIPGNLADILAQQHAAPGASERSPFAAWTSSTIRPGREASADAEASATSSAPQTPADRSGRAPDGTRSSEPHPLNAALLPEVAATWDTEPGPNPGTEQQNSADPSTDVGL